MILIYLHLNTYCVKLGYIALYIFYDNPTSPLTTQAQSVTHMIHFCDLFFYFYADVCQKQTPLALKAVFVHENEHIFC